MIFRKSKASDAARERKETIDAIVMASDLSPRSDRALARAFEIAGRSNARVTVMHGVDDDLPHEMAMRLEQMARDELAKTVDKAASDAPYDVEIVSGKNDEAILDMAAQKNADLIVLGPHKNETGARPIRGTTMERAIRKGDHPVLVSVKPVSEAYQKVVIAVDFSNYSRSALREAFRLAPDATFYITHAYHVPFSGFQYAPDTQQKVESEHDEQLEALIAEEMEHLINESADGGPTIVKIIRNGETCSVLRSQIEDVNADLIVLGTHGRVGFAGAVLGSVAQEFLSRPPCDVMVVKAW